MSDDAETQAQTLIRVMDICSNRNLTPGQRIYEIRRVLTEARS